MFGFQHFKAKGIGFFFPPPCLGFLGFVIGEFNIDRQIHLGGIDGVQSVDDQYLCFCKIGCELVHPLRNKINTRHRHFFACFEGSNDLLDLLPVIFLQTYHIAYPSGFPDGIAFQRQGFVKIIDMDRLGHHAPAEKAFGEHVCQFRFA